VAANFVLSWVRAFLLTQTVEMGLYVRATPGRPLRERVAVAFGASAITHPIVWFVIPDLVRAWQPTGDWQRDWWIAVAIAETWAVTGEAIWLSLFGKPPLRALAWALAANTASFTIGLFLYQWMSW
jgi:hypothetical protein